MKQFWRRAKPIICGALYIALALYFSPLNIVIAQAIATHDVALIWAILFNVNFFLSLFVIALIAGFVAPVYVVASVIEARQKREKLPFAFYPILLCCLINWGSVFGPFRLTGNALWPYRRAGLAQAARRAEPLVAAIEKYRAEQGQTPQNLRDLVPRYIPSVPDTGMAAYPRFLYVNRQQEGQSARFASYQLSVQTGLFMKWDSFNYWPEGDYPAQMYGGRVERIGAWAYVHE